MWKSSRGMNPFARHCVFETGSHLAPWLIGHMWGFTTNNRLKTGFPATPGMLFPHRGDRLVGWWKRSHLLLTELQSHLWRVDHLAPVVSACLFLPDVSCFSSDFTFWQVLPCFHLPVPGRSRADRAWSNQHRLGEPDSVAASGLFTPPDNLHYQPEPRLQSPLQTRLKWVR